MPPPAKRVKATTYRRDSPRVAKLWLRFVLMQLTRDLFAIAKFLFLLHIGLFAVLVITLVIAAHQSQTLPADDICCLPVGFT